MKITKQDSMKEAPISHVKKKKKSKSVEANETYFQPLLFKWYVKQGIGRDSSSLWHSS